MPRIPIAGPPGTRRMSTNIPMDASRAVGIIVRRRRSTNRIIRGEKTLDRRGIFPSGKPSSTVPTETGLVVVIFITIARRAQHPHGVEGVSVLWRGRLSPQRIGGQLFPMVTP